jgi:hypothetical protein
MHYAFNYCGQINIFMTQQPGWDKGVLLQSPLFAALHPVIAQLDGAGFPGLDDLNSLLGQRMPPILAGSGKSLSFVAQERGKLPFEKQYEPRCYLHGEVQTRHHNWHDLFNALVWLTFPMAKAAINVRHYRSLLQRQGPADFSTGPGSQRGAVRDMNTLLDESGVIVASSNGELSGMLGGFRWKELFWKNRDAVSEHMEFHLLGHGLYEKALHPYTGLSGQGLVFAVDQEFFAWPLAQRLTHLDGLVAEYLADAGHCQSTRELAPVPLLGMPGWWEENTREAYYDNTAYFRPARLPARQ